MKEMFIDKEMKYDGSQLRSLFAYMNYGLQGDSIVSWIGPCDIPSENIIDGEDLRAGSEIRGSKMLHFIVELFDVSLITGVVVQRLFAAEVARRILSYGGEGLVVRRGDDIYIGSPERKFNISIATCSPISTLIHFAINISQKDTPVPTASLDEFQLDPCQFSEELRVWLVEEVRSMKAATQKVRSTS